MAAVLLAAAAGWLLPARRGDRIRWLRSPVQVVGPSPWRRSPTDVFLAMRALVPWVARHAAEQRRAEVVELCRALSSELQAGGLPRSALAAAANGLRELDTLIDVAASPYGDVPAALAELGRRPGGGGLAALSACWRVCERSGAGLSVAAMRLADALRDDDHVRREIGAQLAGPRATAVLLAVLPVFGVAMGSAVGAQPLHLLFHTSFGWTLMSAAAVLEAAGLLWTARIIRAAMPP